MTGFFVMLSGWQLLQALMESAGTARIFEARFSPERQMESATCDMEVLLRSEGQTRFRSIGRYSSVKIFSSNTIGKLGKVGRSWRDQPRQSWRSS